MVHGHDRRVVVKHDGALLSRYVTYVQRLLVEFYVRADLLQVPLIVIETLLKCIEVVELWLVGLVVLSIQ